jgi:UDP-N-acetylmuramate--alanine ligase
MSIFDKQNYHFIGIGGIGISAIARMLLLQGKKVSGSDLANSEITEDLQKLGAMIYFDQKQENVGENTEVVIYTVAIDQNNPELKKAKDLNIICKSYPEALGELTETMRTIAVSGTHGKTTTTAMIAHIMNNLGLDPTVIIGSKMLGVDSNFKKGSSDYLVVEACEYKKSFLNLTPQILIITNIEEDHLDYYKDLNEIMDAFKELAERVKDGGFIITNLNNENIKKVIESANLKSGVKVFDYSNIEIPIDTKIEGEHNIDNAKSAIRAISCIFTDKEKIKKSLFGFKGTWRRMGFKGERSGNIYFDDYAHHPTAIKLTLEGVRQKYKDKKIVCAFEPHQQSRTREFFDQFVDSLAVADYIFIAPVYITREKDDGITTNSKIVDKLRESGSDAKTVENPEELKNYIQKLNRNDLCVILMGAGDIYKWTPELLN